MTGTLTITVTIDPDGGFRSNSEYHAECSADVAGEMAAVAAIEAKNAFDNLCRQYAAAGMMDDVLLAADAFSVRLADGDAASFPVDPAAGPCGCTYASIREVRPAKGGRNG